jgi:cell fate (sporulation/competence/biofilm development) regulator YlbF (YheA/YmcA/DUF963 family)
MEEVVEIAKKLAEAIAKSERYNSLRNAEKAVKDDAEASGLLEAFNKATLSILEKEQKMEPVEPDEKVKLADLKEKVAGNTRLQELQKAQVDYSEMMDKVNRALFEELEIR